MSLRARDVYRYGSRVAALWVNLDCISPRGRKSLRRQIEVIGRPVARGKRAATRIYQTDGNARKRVARQVNSYRLPRRPAERVLGVLTRS